MSVENPYKNPSSEINHYGGSDDKFDQYNDDELKLLFRKSKVIGAIGVYATIGTIAILAASIKMSSNNLPLPNYVIFSIGILFLIAAFGSFTRPNWGRTAGIIFCALTLLNIPPIGAIISILGWSAFYPSKVLFGKNRFRHSELKAKYKARESAKKANNGQHRTFGA